MRAKRNKSEERQKEKERKKERKTHGKGNPGYTYDINGKVSSSFLSSSISVILSQVHQPISLTHILSLSFSLKRSHLTQGEGLVRGTIDDTDAIARGEIEGLRKKEGSKGRNKLAESHENNNEDYVCHVHRGCV